ncbi:MAG: T9SS type A sorting domain-containing protein [Bacteroidales bacterium]|nr:T9SS type A sorting domain-containing protein [Bacteroidales bacterium]
MKKVYILFFSFLACLYTFGQQVAREMVIVEIGTGTWCGYCPGAAMGADDLVENGHNVAVLEHHSGDPYQNQYSSARVSYYNITGFPTAVFDGVLSVVGGSATQSMYSSYLPKVQQRNGVPCDFTIDLEFEHTGNDYTATVVVEMVNTNPATNLVLHLAVNESHIPENWGGLQEVNFVTRLMVPDQNGTPLDFSGGNTLTFTKNFTLQPSWEADFCELIAFVQNTGTKEILQGTKVPLALPEFNLDAMAKDIIHPGDIFCGNTLMPVILIYNNGAENLTSVDIEYSINGGTPQTHTWTGDIAFTHSAEVELPEIVYTVMADNTIEVVLSNPNGQPDLNPANDMMSKDFDAAYQIPTQVVNFEVKTDQYPSETTWKVFNSAGTVLYQGGPYSAPNTVYTDTWTFTEFDCYTFTIYDSFGDGICCSYGNGYYKLTDGNNNLFAQGGQFGSEDSKPFERNDPNMVNANFEADVTQIEEGGTVNFSDLSTGPVSAWEWTFEGGEPAVSGDQNPAVTYMNPGVYDVSLTVSNATNSSSVTKADYIVVDDVTGVRELTAGEMIVYPNPFTSETQLLIYLPEQSNVKISIFDQTGKTVYSKNHHLLAAGKHKLIIDANNLEQGIYFLKLQTDGKMYSEKLTVVR